MWPYIGFIAGVTVIFAASLSVVPVPAPSAEMIRYLCLSSLCLSGIGWAVSAMHKRRPPSNLPPEEPLEFVGNIPPTWNIQFTADLATTPPRPKLPPQPIFLPPARLRLGVMPPTGSEG